MLHARSEERLACLTREATAAAVVEATAMAAAAAADEAAAAEAGGSVAPEPEGSLFTAGASYWDDVFAAQAELAARYGPNWSQQIESNLQSVRDRVARERKQREARELGAALARGWGVQVREMRRQGVRLASGAGTGGRQRRRAREQAKAATAPD